MNKNNIHAIATHVVHTSHHYIHLTYLGLVYFEAHGMYGIAAGMMLCAVVLGSALKRFAKGD